MPDTTRTRFTRLYEEYYDDVLAYCSRRIGPTEADDATADVFAVAWRRIDDIEWPTVRPWLYGVARGVLANRLRSSGRRRRLLDRISGMAPVFEELPEVQVVRRAQDEAIIAAVQSLKPTDQEVLLLAAWEELKAPEIAQALGISTSAAEQRLHRAKRRLAAALPSHQASTNQPLRSGDGGR